jgi:LCP family protein required for cell wall assembly
VGARRHFLIAAAAVLPVAAVLVLALGIHTLRHLAPSAALAPPETILVIGSDHRSGTPFRDVNTDTIMLVRLDPNSRTIKVLSLPRDLKVQIPEGGALLTTKLSTVYFHGGPALLIKVLQQQVFPGLKVNHIVDVGFGGFEKMINAIGCVYATSTTATTTTPRSPTTPASTSSRATRSSAALTCCRSCASATPIRTSFARRARRT